MDNQVVVSRGIHVIEEVLDCVGRRGVQQFDVIVAEIRFESNNGTNCEMGIDFLNDRDSFSSERTRRTFNPRFAVV